MKKMLIACAGALTLFASGAMAQTAAPITNGSGVTPLSGLAFGTMGAPATPVDTTHPLPVIMTSAAPLAITSSTPLSVTVTNPSAVVVPSTLATAQVSVGTTATLVVAARATRTRVLLSQSTGNVCVFGGPAVTLTTGFPLQPISGVVMPVDTNAAVYAVCAGATPTTISAMELFS